MEVSSPLKGFEVPVKIARTGFVIINKQHVKGESFRSAFAIDAMHAMTHHHSL
jgi:hypothetical protein